MLRKVEGALECVFSCNILQKRGSVERRVLEMRRVYIQTILSRWVLLAFSVGVVCVSNLEAQIFYSPSSSNRLYAYCYDPSTGGLVTNCNYELGYGYWTYTNGHFHESTPHPSSSFSPDSGNTGASGYAPVTVSTTLVGQEEFVEVWNVDNPNDPGSELDFYVGYNDLYSSSSNLWILIGGSDTGGGTGHGTTAYNHFQTRTAGSGLYAATQQYLASHAGVNQICINDCALPSGGKFDICNAAYPGCTAVTPWANPHISHDRGTAADIAGPTSGQCPVGNRVVIAVFLQRCIANGASSIHSAPEGNHAHCNWADPATYPH